MSATNPSSLTRTDETPSANRWRLWVDGCGGFLLLSGEQWTVGGPDQASSDWGSRSPRILKPRSKDISVQADWPRIAGTIKRMEDLYVWVPQAAKNSSAADSRPVLLTDGNALPIVGSANMYFHQPSSLSLSARLTIAAPHRFNHHVDGVILVNHTLLVGPSSDCHIRCSHATERAVLTRRQDCWLVKSAAKTKMSELVPGVRMELDSIAITLEID